jgi:hypothetical protein
MYFIDEIHSEFTFKTVLLYTELEQYLFQLMSFTMISFNFTPL